MSSAVFRRFEPGDPFPWFRQRNTSNPDFVFDSVGGRYIVLCFFGSAATPVGAQRLAVATRHRPLFDDTFCAFFGVSVDPQDESSGRVPESLPGVRHFWDFDGHVSRLCGALPTERGPAGAEPFNPKWVVLNPDLHVRAVLPFLPDFSDCDRIVELVKALPPVDRFAGMEMHAPVLLLPDVFERSFCNQLIDHYNAAGGEVSGFMRDVEGRTRLVQDRGFKVRQDHFVTDEALRQQIDQRIRRRVVSAIRQFFCFEATRMERYLVACYDGAEGGHFRPHRDNTTRGTAHRRFALSVNLNDGFEGGELVFPEYGSRRYRPPPGAGIVFPCALLHGVTPVQSGRRHAFLPFFYDEAAAAVRESNRQYVEDGA